MSMRIREAVLMACPQCQIRLKVNHPNQAPAQHIEQGKALWSTWQIDYVGPFKPSHGKRYILVGVEVVSGLTMATVVSTATGTRQSELCENGLVFCPFLNVFKVTTDCISRPQWCKTGHEGKPSNECFIHHIIPRQTA